jgi:hypothetical protein
VSASTPPAVQPTFDRDVLVEVLVYHWPTATSGCWCGWAELGKSFAGHVADVYEASVRARTDGTEAAP